jgi:hypothetical protein
MVRRAFVQRSLVEVLLPDSDKLWDPALRGVGLYAPALRVKHDRLST